VCYGTTTKLVSRKHHVYKSFQPLAAEITVALRGRCAIIDGEIVCLDSSGKPRFYDVLYRRGDPVFIAFDILQLGNQNMRELPLIERKRLLRSLIPAGSRILYADHIERFGVRFYDEICRRDLEGIIAKWKYGPYVTGDHQPAHRSLTRHLNAPELLARFSWLKIQNPKYSQIEGRSELFDRKFRGKSVAAEHGRRSVS
jgi:ATP-dependent DNA ligase